MYTSLPSCQHIISSTKSFDQTVNLFFFQTHTNIYHRVTLLICQKQQHQIYNTDKMMFVILAFCATANGKTQFILLQKCFSWPSSHVLLNWTEMCSQFCLSFPFFVVASIAGSFFAMSLLRMEMWSIISAGQKRYF